ncbi:MAG: hypothetical protein CVT88_02300 [Candidatus Altiarchaeales archaeon HGW-Altiarchaeales-1]|nr:MAG: hypothetical protein CVT88_02300 [Candidatus Altiarchaeales archaeon HGW-Altiarchaeales-1]
MSDILNDGINFIINEFTRVEYTWFNTIMFGIVLIIALFLVIKLMKKWNIEIDKNFVFALLPFILFGSTMRALADAEIYPNRPDVLAFFFIAPGIYFTIFLITIASLLIGLYIFKKKYYKFMLVAGCLLFGLNLVLIAMFLYSHSATANFGVFVVFLIFAMCVIVIYALMKLNFFKFSNFLRYEKNYIIVLAHLFDASTTYIGIAFFGYFEKHVLPSAAIEIFSPAIMFVLKLIVIPALYFIDQIDDKTTRRMIKIVIFILGISPAIRNFTRILLGV